VKHLAWLHAVPDPEYRKKHQNAPKRQTRQEQLEAQESSLLELPDVEHGGHVIQWLHEVGPTQQGMNGPEPLSWQEISAWREATGVEATAEELVMLRNLSRQYASQYHRSDNPEEPAPYKPRAKDKAAIASQISSVLQQASRGFRNE